MDALEPVLTANLDELECGGPGRASRTPDA
jgi:hypothetical protein